MPKKTLRKKIDYAKWRTMSFEDMIKILLDVGDTRKLWDYVTALRGMDRYLEHHDNPKYFAFHTIMKELFTCFFRSGTKGLSWGLPHFENLLVNHTRIDESFYDIIPSSHWKHHVVLALTLFRDKNIFAPDMIAIADHLTEILDFWGYDKKYSSMAMKKLVKFLTFLLLQMSAKVKSPKKS